MVTHKWAKVFQNVSNKICGRHLFKFFKGCLPQIFFWSIHDYLDPSSMCSVIKGTARIKRGYFQDLFLK